MGSDEVWRVASARQVNAQDDEEEPDGAAPAMMVGGQALGERDRQGVIAAGSTK